MILPTCLIGFVRGKLRWEKCGGDGIYTTVYTNFVLKDVRPADVFADEQSLVKEKYAITHLQKKSRFGYLLMRHEKWWHLCFHVWFTFRYQQEGVPGSEKVFYWRAGWSRWDAGDCKYVMGWVRHIFGKPITIPFGTWYGPGLHWD